MRIAEPAGASWKAELRLAFRCDDEKTVLAQRRSEGPLVVQKPLYPEGPEVCHAIIVHPPGGIAGGPGRAQRIRYFPGSFDKPFSKRERRNFADPRDHPASRLAGGALPGRVERRGDGAVHPSLENSSARARWTRGRRAADLADL